MAINCRNASDLSRFLFTEDGKLKSENVKIFDEAVRAKKLRLRDFDNEDLTRTFLGDAAVQRLKENDGQTLESVMSLRESGPPVKSTYFPQIVGQLLFSEVRGGFDMEANVFTPLVPTVQSRIKGTEIVPSITRVDPADVETVVEGQAYPRVAVTEEYFTLPAKVKKGAILEATRESFTFDKTNLLADRARGIGTALGQVREDETLDALAGVTNNYIRNGSSSNTYLTAGDYINNASSTPLNDHTDIETAVRLADAILEPNISRPLMHAFPHLIVCPNKEYTARKILTATSVRNQENASAGTRDVTEISPSPLAAMRLLTSIQLQRRIVASGQTAAVANGTWFLGDVSKLLRWYEVWPLALVQRGMESEAAFDRDISMQWKASYYGVTAVREPRFMLRLEDTVWA